METLNPKAFLTLEDVCAEIAAARRKYAPVARIGEVDGRTVRFYIEKELLPSVRSGPGKKYPYETVWKILFIRLVQRRFNLPLAQIREAMVTVDVETMRRVVTGEEPLEVAAADDAEAITRHTGKGRVVTLSRAADKPDRWKVLLRSEAAVLKVRPGLSPTKIQQLKQIADLVHSIVEAR